MRPERERAGSADGDAEQEVDLGRYWWALVARWWLVVLCVALGLLIGYLVSLGGGNVYQAKATVYLGQPLTPASGAQIQGLQTNPSTVNQIVKSESVVLSVASQVGSRPGQLRSGISTKAVAGAVARSGQAPLVEISVRLNVRRQSAEAANLLAGIVVDELSAYPDAKIALLAQQAAAEEDELQAIDNAISGYQDAIAAGSSLSTTERLLLVSLLANEQQERGQLVSQHTQTELSLALARDVERAQVVTRASASKVTARGRSSSMIVGAVIGLVVGLLLALLWEPVRDRLGRRRAAA